MAPRPSKSSNQSFGALRIIDDVDQARSTILRRQASAEIELPEAVRRRIADVFGQDLSAEEVVNRIIEMVASRGDSAIREFVLSLDGVELTSFEVTRSQIESAYGELPTRLINSLRLAADRIRAFHAMNVPRTWLDFKDGGALGQLIRPLERVGIYSPRGAAGYPSTILMSAIPARVAGVDEVIIATPPTQGAQISPATLVAADLAGVDRVLTIGGAQAIAALAYGTETVPRVDKILGPGNIFVALAKRRVFGQVDIDQIAGPTETLILADASANPIAIAADLLAQAEHDPLASALLITTSRPMAEAVAEEIDRQLSQLPRREIAQQALERNSGAVLVADLKQALALANEYAPEHLCLLVADPWSLLGQVRNAGGVFLGEYSTEAVGDYTAGPSHVMPTGGTARFSSPLNVWDFLKVTSVFALSPAQVERLGPATIDIAESEGFVGHANAVRCRLGRDV